MAGHERYIGSDGKKISPFSMVEDFNGNFFVFLEEVKDIPGHCLVCDTTGHLYPLKNTSEYKAKHPVVEENP